ncbi:hypothetical protein IAE37_001278 [Pseudomonas sp. S31]|nr:hypothetical protein [Pseudomonas sp. S31]
MRLPTLVQGDDLGWAVPALSRLKPLLQKSRAPCRSGFSREEASTGKTQHRQVFLLYLWETCFHLRKEATNAAAFRTFPVRKLYS